MRMQMALAWNANYFTACQSQNSVEGCDKDNCHEAHDDDDDDNDDDDGDFWGK